MIPSFRLLRLLAYGAPLWFVHALMPWGWLIPTSYLAVLLGLALKEVITLPGSDQLVLKRRFPDRLSFDTDQEIMLSLTNKTKFGLWIDWVENLPPALELKSELPPFEVVPAGKALLTYVVKPIMRGKHTLGSTNLRVSHPGGLMLRQLEVPQSDVVKVYPKFMGVDHFDLLARINEREEAARIPRVRRGCGSEWESLRNYIPGEDLRLIDWKISAKRGTLISRNLQIEKGQQLAVMVDAGRFMQERIGSFSRFEHAMNAVVMLGFVAQKRGDSMALATFSNRIESFLPPIKGSSLLPKTLESIFQVQPKPVESDYWHVVARVMDKLKKRSLVVMITDVLDMAGSTGLIRNLYRAARKHLVLCVVFVEQKIYDTASGKPEDSPGAYLKAAAAYDAVERGIALEEMRRRGILVLETAPENLSLSLIRKYLEIRQADLQ